MSIGKFSVSNPVLINILMVSILILGAFSIIRLPQEQYAEVPFYWVNIITPFPGVTAPDVEKSLTIPVENKMQGLKKLKRIQSVSSEGLSVVRVEFDDNVDNDEFSRLFQEVQTRMSSLSLPDGTLEPLVDDFSSGDFLPVIEVIVTGNNYDTISRKAEELQKQLERIPDVSGVDAVGNREKQILIEAEREKLAVLGLSLQEITRSIQAYNRNIPGGILDNGSREYLIRTIGEAVTPEDFGEIILRRGDKGEILTIDQVAEVRQAFDPKGVEARFNGSESITLRVTKNPGSSSTGIIDEVKEVLAAKDDTNISYTLFNDSTVQIKDSISVLVNNALVGLILLVVILFFFIGLRNALITALGIPVTFALTFLILEISGETLNSNTLFGLVLVLGLIVDHGIVIVENSYRFETLGKTRKLAAIDGVNQVAFPVIAATATTVAAFLPLMILPGTIGKFLRVIPLTVSIALLVSTGEALFFLPAHYADWGKGKKLPVRKGLDKLERSFSAWFDKLYQRKKVTVPVILILMFASFALVPLLKQDLFSAEDFTYFTIDINMPAGTPQRKTSNIVRQFEEKLLERVGGGEVTAIRSSIGFGSGSDSTTTKGNIAQILVDLSEAGEGRERSITEIMAEIKEELKTIPGPDEILFSKAANGPPVSPSLEFRVRGDNYNDLSQVVKKIKERLSSRTEVLNIRDSLETGSPELKVIINPERASAYGLSTLDIGNFIRDQLEGIEAAVFFSENRETEVIVRYSGNFVDNASELTLINIPTNDGRQIPFSAVAELFQGESVSSIKRVDGERELGITADIYDDEYIESVNEEIRLLYETELAPLYPDLQLIIGGELAELSNLLFQILRVFLIGIFLIYLILGAQFKSYSQPFLILFSVPFAFAGVILFLFISDTAFSTTVLYAGVALAGIAVNDAIVLISFINELRAEGKKMRDSIKEAVQSRLRPIILTSLTTIAGLAPTALGLGGKSVVWGPMASTIVFGLIFSTLTTLIFIPTLYGLFYDKKRSTP